MKIRNLTNLSIVLSLCLTLTSCQKSAKLEVIESETSITETTIETAEVTTEETTVETEVTSDTTVTETSETEVEETEVTTIETTEMTEPSVTCGLPLVSPTATPIPVPTATNVPTSTPTPIPVETAAPTQAPQLTATPTPMPTATPVPTATPIPTPTAAPTPTPLPARLYAMADVTYTVDCWSQDRGEWQEVVTYNVEVVQNNGENYIGQWVVCDDDTVANNLIRDYPYCYHYSNGYNITLTTEPYTK